MKRKIFKIIGATIAVAGLLFLIGTAGVNDLAAEQGTAGLTLAQTLLRSVIGIVLFAAGTIGALTL